MLRGTVGWWVGGEAVAAGGGRGARQLMRARGGGAGRGALLRGVLRGRHGRGVHDRRGRAVPARAARRVHAVPWNNRQYFNIQGNNGRRGARARLPDLFVQTGCCGVMALLGVILLLY